MTEFNRFEMSIDLTVFGETPSERRDALVEWLHKEAGMIACNCYAGLKYAPKRNRVEAGRWSVDGRKVLGAMEYDL